MRLIREIFGRPPRKRNSAYSPSAETFYAVLAISFSFGGKASGLPLRHFDPARNAWYDSHVESSLAQYRPQIDELCRRFHVHRLELFGSAATERFDPLRSDLDFLVDFEPLVEGQHADAYFGLLAAMESLFARPIDLVMTGAIRNRYFLEAIEPTRTLLYAA